MLYAALNVCPPASGYLEVSFWKQSRYEETGRPPGVGGSQTENLPLIYLRKKHITQLCSVLSLEGVWFQPGGCEGMVLWAPLLAFQNSKSTKLHPPKALIHKMSLVSLLALRYSSPAQDSLSPLAHREGSSQVCRGSLQVLGRPRSIKPVPALKQEKPHSNRLIGNKIKVH